MPHIDEDFYKSIGSEEETKEVIQACPRSSTMNYSPPPLNENITSAAKKTDTTLYGIQIALDQASRSLDNFVYRKCKEGTEAAKEVEAVALVSEMRLILASIATNISQSRMKNVYQAMNIPGKPKQLAGNSAKPFFDQELLDKAISTIKSVKKARLRKPFQMRHQYGPFDLHPVLIQRRKLFSLGRGNDRGRGRGGPLGFLPSSPVGNRLTMFKKAWERLTNSSWVKKIVDKGFKIPFMSPKQLPTLITNPRRYKRKLSREASRILTEEIASLLYKKAIEEVDRSSPGFYNQLFCNTKKTGQLRQVLDLRKVNKFVHEKNSKMESLNSICKLIVMKESNKSLDLQDTFLGILIHKACRKYLRFTWNGQQFMIRNTAIWPIILAAYL
ncbi:hypothetical protein AYI69_g6657 [Smittium culicis]|uniref:Uncharacterized protein n=1 Tax=Smittium culicis TaxID=133412 RepID=A0A1R1XXE0_9FUNG|nr:hypothetical protein AYI69_g6657 [Smittium culicis]